MPTVTIAKSIQEGLRNLKENFWAYALIVIILLILETIGNGQAVRENIFNKHWLFPGPVSGGFLAFLSVFLSSQHLNLVPAFYLSEATGVKILKSRTLPPVLIPRHCISTSS